MKIKKWKWEVFTGIVAIGLAFLGAGYGSALYFLFSGTFVGFFLSLLAYRRIKEYIIGEVIRLIEEKEMEAVKEFVKGLQ